MKANLPTTKVDGARPENTHYSRMRRLGAFLNQHGIKIKKSYSSALNDPGLLADSEFPKLKGKKPSKYSDEMIGFRGAEPDPRSGEPPCRRIQDSQCIASVRAVAFSSPIADRKFATFPLIHRPLFWEGRRG